MFPAGIAAANLLGFTTQNAARVEVATDGLSLPRLIVGKETVIHTRRPVRIGNSVRPGPEGQRELEDRVLCPTPQKGTFHWVNIS